MTLTILTLAITTTDMTDNAAASSPHGDGPTNRLAQEASPYLQLHRNNPVDWYPWGDEALARAREENKPIFLSVGYSTCFWCHVMERETFSNPEIAALMNANFINIKVDREERPDIDEIYMTATQMMTGSGGWPNSVFLTPDGAPFFAGTYFPPEDSRGRKGFPSVLRQLSDSWENRHEEVIAYAKQIRERITAQSKPLPAATTSFNPSALLGRAASQVESGYEPVHGGFSTQTKFPSPPRLELLLAAHRAESNPKTLAILTHTLDEMAAGGIYDHVGGGFHRYSTETTWTIPHFEKMLYDNAQLLGVYARAYEVARRPRYRQVTLEIARYLEREMKHPEGGFYSAQDAEVDGHEGKSYLWTREQIESILGKPRTEAFLSVYELAPMPDGHGAVLRVTLPIEKALDRHNVKNTAELLAKFENDRAALLKSRDTRPQPLRDDKVLAAWNGLAIRGLAEAARILEKPQLLRTAESAADFVLRRLHAKDGTLHRSFIAGQVRETGVLEDYAYLADGLLALHAATGKARWLTAARRLADRMIEDFEDEADGGFFLTAKTSKLFARPRAIYDGVEPSGTGIALRVLFDLSARTEESRYAQAAERTHMALGGAFTRSPALVGTAVMALATTTSNTKAATTTASRTNVSAGSPLSKDHVHVSARRSDMADALVVSVQIDKGWHINANPASLPFLIPTTVEIEGSEPEIQYPVGVAFSPEFSPEELSTYQDTIEILVGLEPSAGIVPSEVKVRYQACSENLCLAPATTRVKVQ